MALQPELLAILACPVPECHARLALREARLVCTRCGLQYHMERGWPVLIPEEAEPPVAVPQPGAAEAPPPANSGKSGAARES